MLATKGMKQVRHRFGARGYWLKVSYVSGVIWRGDGKLFVPSSTEPNKFYNISHENGRLRCDCEAISVYRYDHCKHLDRAAYLLENYRPTTAEQAAFAEATAHDPLRSMVGSKAHPERAPRSRRVEVA